MLLVIIFAINVVLHRPVLDSFLFALALAVGSRRSSCPPSSASTSRTARKQMAERRSSSSAWPPSRTSAA